VTEVCFDAPPERYIEREIERERERESYLVETDI